MSWLDDQRKRFLGLANAAGRNVRDIFDANTASDQAKRIAAGQPRYYQDQQRQQGNPTVKYGTNLFSQSYNRARDYVDANTAQDRAARLAQGRKEIEQQTFQAKYAPLLRPAKQVFDVANANPIMNPIGFALKAAEPAKNVFAPVKSVNNFVHGVDEGVKRSLVGTAQSTAGLVDLVSPGEGQSSLTKLLNSTAEGIDQRVKDNGYNNIAYKGGQIATDIGTFFVPGTQASKVGGVLVKGVKFIPIGSKSLKGVSEAFNVVSNTLDKSGKVGKNANKVAKFYLKPENAIDIAVDTGMNAGYRSARGEDYSSTAFLQDAGLSTLFGGAIGGATVTAKKVINKIWGDADIAKIAKSTDANEIRDALLMKYPNLNKFELDKMAEDLVNKTSRREVKGALEEAVTNHEPHTAPTSETITSDPNAPEINKPTTPDVPPATNPVQPTAQPITQPIAQPGAQPVSIKERYPQLNEAEATRLETKLNEAQTPEEKAVVELEAKARNDAVQAEITTATEAPVANSNQQAVEADTAVMNDNTANVAAQDTKAPGEPNTKTMQDLQTLGVTLQDLKNRQLPPVKENQALNGIISATEDLKKEGIPDAVVERALRDPNAPTDPYAFKNFVRANANRFANDVNTNVVKSEAPIEKTPSVQKFGWNTEDTPQGTKLFNRNGKHVATITEKKGRFTASYTDGTRIATGSDANKLADDVARKTFYAQELPQSQNLGGTLRPDKAPEPYKNSAIQSDLSPERASAVQASSDKMKSALEFDKTPTPKKAYHSTASLEIGGGKLRASGADSAMGEGVYLHTNPETAKYAGAMQADGNIADQRALDINLKTDNLFKWADQEYPTPEQVALIKSRGYDGIYKKGGEIVVFDPNKIEIAKSGAPIEKTPTMSPEEQSLYNSAPGIKQADGPAPNIEPNQNIVGDTSEWLTPSSRDNLNEAGIDDAMIKYLQDKGYSKNQIETFGNLLYAPHRVTQPEGLMYHVIGAPENPPVAGFVNNTPNIERAPIPVTDSSGSLAPLGKISESFFDNFKGDVKINYPMLDRLGKRVTQAIDEEFKAIGSSFSDVAQKVQAGANNGIKRLEDAGLTPQEADIIRRAQAEMNYVRRRASLGKKEIGQGDLGEMYIPRQVEGRYAGDSLFKGFRETKPGNEFSRKKNGIELENIDYDSSVIGEYITRYGDTKLTQRERIIRAFEKDNPDVDKEVVSEAALDMINLQDEVNNLKTKISVAGLGKRKTLSDGQYVDTAARMSKIGNDLGKKQVVLNETPSGLTNGDRINSVEVSSGKTVGDYTGLNQYRDAKSFANRHFKEAGGDRAELAKLVQNRLINDYDLPPETVQQISASIDRIAKDVPDEIVTGILQSSYEMAAKQQLMKNLQNINIKNKTLRKDVSDLTNQLLRSGSIERQTSAKVVSSILTTTNAIFRKFNISSAINELSDLSAITTVYGKNSKLVPDFNLIKEFGLGEIDPAIESFIKQIENGNSIKSVVKKINNATNLYKFVETYKAAVMANSAKAHYSGLSGDALTKRVLKDYRDIVLPVDAFTKTVLDNFPLYTQYMSWGARNLQKEGRLLTGKLDTGILENKTVGARIARDLYANLPAKTVFWLTSNGLKGTSILTAFGLTDFTGLTSQDYSGIAEEDKSAIDKVVNFTNQSTTLSLLGTIYQSYEKERLKNSDKYKNADYNPYANNNFFKQTANQFTPQFLKNATGAYRLNKDGYSQNAGGRVQYEAPTDAWNKAKSWVFGKNQTSNARQYSGNKNIIDRVKEDGAGKTLVALRDMAAEQVGLKDKNHQRPLSKDYSTAYKEADKSLRKATLDGGREFNSKLDNLKKNDVTAYNNYISAMDGNHVGPEYWREIVGGSASGGADLKLFNTIKDRKKQLKADMERVGKNKDGKYNYDPIYDLPEGKLRMVLAEKSAATGEDIPLKNILYKEAWYNDYQKKVEEYNKNKVASDNEFKQSPRSAEWDKYNKQLVSLGGKSETSALKDKYPLVYQLQQYGFGTPDSKAFLRNNYDSWKAQKDALDKEKLAIINKMRAIEGHDPMSLEAYAQATSVDNPDSNSSNSYTKFANSGYTKFRSKSDQPTQYKLYLADLLANDKNAKPISSLKINTTPKKVKMKSFAPKAAKVKRIRIK